MPELPDLHVFSANLSKRFKGKKLKSAHVRFAGKLKSNEAEFRKNLEKQKLAEVYRAGKELRFAFDNGAVMGMHLMLNGEIKLLDEAKEPKDTIAALIFEDDSGFALTDYQKVANVQLNPEESEVPDALEINYTYLKKALQRKVKIKTLLTDQKVVRGIGNAYADEILWEAGISPFSVSAKIPDEKIKELASLIVSVLKDAIKEIMRIEPDLVSGEIRDFLKIHNYKKKQSPTGAEILIDTTGGRKTYYTKEQELFE